MMPIESRILDADNISNKRDIEHPRVGNHIASRFPFFCELYPVSIEECQTPIFSIGCMRNRDNRIYCKKYTWNTHEDAENEEEFSHFSSIWEKKNLTKCFSLYNALTSIADSRFLFWTKNSLPRWTK